MKLLYYSLSLLLTGLIHCTPSGKNTAVKSDVFINFAIREFYYYEINVTGRKVLFTISRPDSVLLHKEAIPLSSKKYTDFVIAIEALHITTRPYKEVGCIGGGSDYLTLYAGTPKEIKGHISYCEGGIGDLEGDINAATALFRGLVPGIDKKLDKAEE